MYIKVRAYPKAKKERFIQKTETEFEAHVKEPAERNLANGRIVELVREHYGVSTGKVRIITGHRSPVKMLSVEEG